ncbi:unnamed protein product, partial [Ectocarpus sp. 8 AP-2014]
STTPSTGTRAFNVYPQQEDSLNMHSPSAGRPIAPPPASTDSFTAPAPRNRAPWDLWQSKLFTQTTPKRSTSFSSILHLPQQARTITHVRHILTAEALLAKQRENFLNW